MGNDTPYDSRRYLALTLDPVHVGTGGHSLRRVDMSIVREPGTNLPKIPGTSLSGTARTYAAMQYDGKFPGCAGQGQESSGQNTGHCGGHDCPVCVTFGFASGGRSGFQGLAQFSDAQLVLFPVHSLAGPVWVTSPALLDGVGIEEEGPEDGRVRLAEGVRTDGRLNLGWLMLERDDGTFSLDGRLPGLNGDIKSRAVLVSDRLFGHIVNDNLEVRTSVSIDPATGAASEGALFTYEALPRTAVLAFEVVVSDPKHFRIKGVVPLDGEIGRVRETVEKGIGFFKDLGVGGMNTRGMGRMRVWEDREENGR